MQTRKSRAMEGILAKRLSLDRRERHIRIVRHNAEKRQPHTVHNIVDGRVHFLKQPRAHAVDNEPRRNVPPG